MLDRGRDVEPAAFASLLAQLRGDAPLPLRLPGRGLCGGSAPGRLVGGSLTLLAASVGTSWEVDTRRAILLLEDVGERPYRIDRMLQQLAGAGILGRAVGVGVGAFQSCEDAKYPRPDVAEVIEQALRPLGVPVVTDLPFGHVRDNFPWPVGGRATIDGRSGELRIEEQGVKISR
jgi:muramoyltetrapeptide carboxypeptidase